MDIPDQEFIEAIRIHRRKYEDTPESARRMVASIDSRIAWLVARGLRPHPTVTERRADYADRASQNPQGVNAGGPTTTGRNP